MRANKATLHNLGGEFKPTHIPLPEPLPEDPNMRALWIGYEAARWFPFDPLIYLERSAVVGGGAVLSGDDGGVAYCEPLHGSAEYEFLRGWHNGCRGSAKMVARVLKQNRRFERRMRRLPR